MPEILKLLIKYRTPVSISTKSSLLLRDRDLFVELGETAGAHVAISVTTTDDDLRKKLEPGSSPTAERFEILEAFKGTQVMTGVLMMPILPYLTDSMENLESLYKAAQEVRADYVIPGLLNLRQPTKGHFLNFIKITFPELYMAYVNYYSGRSDKKTYRETVYGRISKLKKRYPLSPKNNPFPKPPEQLQLF
jgi:DNA repair photolyase